MPLKDPATALLQPLFPLPPSHYTLSWKGDILGTREVWASEGPRGIYFNIAAAWKMKEGNGMAGMPPRTPRVIVKEKEENSMRASPLWWNSLTSKNVIKHVENWSYYSHWQISVSHSICCHMTYVFLPLPSQQKGTVTPPGPVCMCNMFWGTTKRWQKSCRSKSKADKIRKKDFVCVVIHMFVFVLSQKWRVRNFCTDEHRAKFLVTWRDVEDGWEQRERGVVE